MPSMYTLIKFLHVSGDIGIFIGIGAQLAGLAALRRAQYTNQARILVWLIRVSESMAVISVLLTLATGLYMAWTVWTFRTSWIIVSLASLIVLVLPVIRILIEPRMKAMVNMIEEAPEGPLSEAMYERIHDPVLGGGLQTLAVIVLGIVFLMTTKPTLAVSIIAMAAAIALGATSGLLLRQAASRAGRDYRKSSG